VLKLVASAGMTEDTRALFEGLDISPSDTPSLASILEDSEPRVLTSDTADDYVSALLGEVGMSSVAIVPITRSRRFFGVVAAAFTSAVIDADGDLVHRLTGMADHAATAFQNSDLLEQVQRQALHDPLTDLPNGRLLEDRVGVALAGAAREGHAVGLMFLDLDRFKPINDTYGHAAGDAVLVEVGRRIRKVLRAEDTVARLAGDEFVVLLPRVANRDEATTVAQKVASVLAHPFTTIGDDVVVSASIGLAMFPDDGGDYRALLLEADVAMYRAKQRPSALTGLGPR
jgi:diguanylate cyclase (GGDEF)-like protein